MNQERIQYQINLITFMCVILTGAFLNIMVVAQNNGKMPVILGQEFITEKHKGYVDCEGVVNCKFADYFNIGGFYFSIGDVFIFIGGYFIFYYIFKRYITLIYRKIKGGENAIQK